MQFMQCGVYESEFEKLICRNDESERHEALPLVMVGCGVCHEWFFADAASLAPESKDEGMLIQAERRLAQECPDHAHKFTIDAAFAL